MRSAASSFHSFSRFNLAWNAGAISPVTLKSARLPLLYLSLVRARMMVAGRFCLLVSIEAPKLVPPDELPAVPLVCPVSPSKRNCDTVLRRKHSLVPLVLDPCFLALAGRDYCGVPLCCAFLHADHLTSRVAGRLATQAMNACTSSGVSLPFTSSSGPLK